MKFYINYSPIIDILPRPKFESEFYKWYQNFQEITKPYNEFSNFLEKNENYKKCKNYIEFKSECMKYFLELSKDLNGLEFRFNIVLSSFYFNNIIAFIAQPNKDFPLIYDCSKLSSNKDIPFFNPLDKYPIKIMKKLRLKTFKKIRDDRIYKDSNGFIISDKLAKKFKDVSLSGYELSHINNCNSKIHHKNMFCLTAKNILPKSENNILRYTYEEDNIQSLGYEGTLIYNKEDLKNIKDFNYPCEATNRDGTTELIVSKKFKDFCEKEQIKGINFIPIFEKESELYNEYIELVKNLCQDLINSNSKHRIGYSKINPKDILQSFK